MNSLGRVSWVTNYAPAWEVSANPIPYPSGGTLEALVKSSAAASSSVPGVLANAPTSSVGSTNALQQEMGNLALPQTESLFPSPAYWDAQPLPTPGTTFTGEVVGATDAFSLFGLSTGVSILLLGVVVWVLWRRGK